MKDFVPDSEFEKENEDLIRSIRNLKVREVPEALDAKVQRRMAELEEERQRGETARHRKRLPQPWLIEFIFYEPGGRLALAVALAIVVCTSAYFILVKPASEEQFAYREPQTEEGTFDSFRLTEIDSIPETSRYNSFRMSSYASHWRSLEERIEKIEIQDGLGIVQPSTPSLQHYIDTIRALSRRGTVSDFELEFAKALQSYSREARLYIALGDAYTKAGITENAKAAYWRADQVRREAARPKLDTLKSGE